MRRIAFLGDSRRVASVDDKKVTFWSVPEGKLLFPPAHLTVRQPVRIASASADGRVIALAAGVEIGLVNTQQAGEFRSLGHESAAVTALAISADGRWVAAGVGSQVSIWDVGAGIVTRRLAMAGNGVGALAFSPDGLRLAASSIRPFASGRGVAIQLWNLSDGQELLRWGSLAEDLAFSPDGRTLAANTETPFGVGSWRAAVKLYDTSSGAELWQSGGTFDPIAFFPDGSRLVSGGLQGATVFDAATGKEIRTLPHGANLHVSSLAFSPDGGMLATGADDSRIRLWRTANWTRVDSGEGHDGPAQVVAF